MKAYSIPDELIRMKIMYEDFDCSAMDEGEKKKVYNHYW